jgi:hypothetical protein
MPQQAEPPVHIPVETGLGANWHKIKECKVNNRSMMLVMRHLILKETRETQNLTPLEIPKTQECRT